MTPEAANRFGGFFLCQSFFSFTWLANIFFVPQVSKAISSRVSPPIGVAEITTPLPQSGLGWSIVSPALKLAELSV